MTTPDPDKEPRSETEEKQAIQKTHEEFVGDMARPSRSKQDYEKKKPEGRRKAKKPPGESPGNPNDSSA